MQTILTLQEPAGLERDQEPITFGFPLPKKMVQDISCLGIQDEAGEVLPSAFTVLARWSDGSARWVLCDTVASLKEQATKTIRLTDSGPEQRQSLLTQADERFMTVQTANSLFVLDNQTFLPFVSAEHKGKLLIQAETPGLVLTDLQGGQWLPCIDQQRVIYDNPMRLSLLLCGGFVFGEKRHTLQFACRLHFRAGCDTLRMDLTLKNPRAARHPGNTWDLGDPGSVQFKDLSLSFRYVQGEAKRLVLQAAPDAEPVESKLALSLYQDSSGGENWYSKNHVNRHGEIPLRFRGYELRKEEDVISRGERARPMLAACKESGALGLTVPCFWENFPKAVQADSTALSIGLFPDRFADLFELQAGELKTHTVFMSLSDSPESVMDSLNRMQEPIQMIPDPEWLRRCNAFPGVNPAPLVQDVQDDDTFELDASGFVYQEYEQLIASALEGERSFFARREIIDEYGWRNFGDLYADHEAVFHQGPETFISHYNNQYDVIKGAVCQFWRSGRPEWFRLARELADHVADIDIYHTGDDRYQYNHGLFWHTDHHLDAATSTHRSISRDHFRYKQDVGGGPAPDHNYASGLALMHLLTGEDRFKQAALELASNIEALIHGPDTLAETGYRLVHKVLLRLKAQPNHGDPAFDHVFGLLDGPGRASGNGLNILMDAFILTGEGHYLDLAEHLICSCVSPEDDIKSMDLHNAELRWMYTVFVKALGRYIELKKSEGRRNAMLDYARASFMHFAQWMLENEYPYLDKPEILEFPNETWAAQELRKSDILAMAGAMLSGQHRDRFMEHSFFFFTTGIEHLKRFENKALTRPLVLLMTNGMEHMEIFSQWRKGELPEGLEIEGFKQTWKDRNPKRNAENGVRRVMQILGRTSPVKEWRWIRDRLGRR